MKMQKMVNLYNIPLMTLIKKNGKFLKFIKTLLIKKKLRN